MNLPTIVYKCPGPHSRPGGTYDYRGINTAEELEAAHEEGWHNTMPDAIAYYEGNLTPTGSASIVKDPDIQPPTRAELEVKATELDIKFDGRTSDAKLLEKITETLQA